MDLEISVEKLKGQKIFLALPMYGGQCTGATTHSLMNLTAECMRFGIGLLPYFLFNESLVTRARNYCVDAFLRSDCTVMMFIDSDIEFKAIDILAMLTMMTDEPDKYKIVCGPYPKKMIAWEKVKAAVDQGFADEDPQELVNFVGDYVFNTANKSSFQLDEPVEVLESGTGFMLISRDVFGIFKAAYPELEFKPDHVRTKDFNGDRMIHAYFDTIIDPDTKRYLSEDYMFCQYARRAGIATWLCPWVQLKHHGSYVFGGSLSALAAIKQSHGMTRK